MIRNSDTASGLRRRLALPVAIAMSASFVVIAASVVNSVPAYADPVVTTFNLTGTVETYTVPDAVTRVVVETWGAQGGTCTGSASQGGRGGHATATLTVTPGEVLRVRVGGTGGQTAGGFNGGGDGRTQSPCGAGGGGATDVRQGGDALADRVLVAGGGGGSNGATDPDYAASGGAGGGNQGGHGGGICSGIGGSGTTGGLGAGGTAPCAGDTCAGAPGSLGMGGSGCGGGGGGGLAGGGSGSVCLSTPSSNCPTPVVGAGAGGSGSAGSNAGVRSGDGLATITLLPPTAPSSFGAGVGDGQVTLLWQSPLDPGSAAISSYVMTPYVGGSPQTPQSFPPSTTATTITGLTNGQTYTFTVAAVNAVGSGPTVTTTVVVGAPTPPRSLSVVPGNAAATLHWVAPVRDNGSAITGYVATIYVGSTVQSQWNFDGTATSGTITSLNNGTTYGFAVAAVNARGAGLPSAVATQAVGAPTAPGKPAALQAGDRKVNVSLVYPATDNGAGISSFKIVPYIAGVAQSGLVVAPKAWVTFNKGLINGVTYTFRVAAANGRGWSPFSVASAPVLVGTPDAPTSVSATPKFQQAIVSWVAQSDAGSTITGYVVTPFVSGVAQPKRTFNSAATSESVTGLTNGNSYTFTVAAINARGSGPASAQSTPVIVGTPNAPSGVTATAGSSSAVVHWTAPSSDGGSAITAYIVTPYRNGVVQAPWNFTPSTTTRTITGLSAGQSYKFTVAAQNARGRGFNSAPSNSVVPT